MAYTVYGRLSKMKPFEDKFTSTLSSATPTAAGHPSPHHTISTNGVQRSSARILGQFSPVRVTSGTACRPHTGKRPTSCWIGCHRVLQPLRGAWALTWWHSSYRRRSRTNGTVRSMQCHSLIGSGWIRRAWWIPLRVNRSESYRCRSSMVLEQFCLKS
ncbi:hypothetical protein BJV77DRAFT_1018234 [Russula vinacea]|nr:hypothetical protein BJV77DRAFT_1018234 [Russula vinacea]